MFGLYTLGINTT